MIPETLEKIRTNVSDQLQEILDAITNNEVEWTPDGSLFGGSNIAFFFWKGDKYELTEWFEVVDSITKL